MNIMGAPSIIPENPTERRTVFVGHSLVNGLGVLSIAVMHIFGSLDATWAAGIIGGICGVWGFNTRKGPPAAPPGMSGLLMSPLIPSILGKPW